MSREVDTIIKVTRYGHSWTGTGKEVLFSNLWWYECVNESGETSLIRL